MTTRPLVFTGPSTHGVDLGRWPGIDFRPPAVCGDILAAVREGRRRIGLIDGVFRDAPSVWHKEILHALSRGVAVLGAASMGALRAAECAAFGMQGVGGIFEDYAAGRRTADADVALAYGPAGLDYAPLSLPLVDAEATVAELRRRRLLPAKDCAAMARAAADMHFSLRSFEAMAREAGLAPAVADILASAAVNRKREDAQALLDLIGTLPEDGLAAPPDFRFSDTWFFRALVQRQEGGA
jgi:hypothetical protein